LKKQNTDGECVCSNKTYDKQNLRRNKPSNALINLYLASMADRDTLFMEVPISAGLLRLFSSTILLALENASCLGRGNFASLVSIDITSDIIGLSTALSSTHSKPTWMHLKTWSLEQDSLSIGPTSSNGLPAFHSSHAWTKFTFNVKIKPMQLAMYNLWGCMKWTYISHKIKRAAVYLKVAMDLSTTHNFQH